MEVMPFENDDGSFRYSSASPDEEALCAAAAYFDVVFRERTTMELRVTVGAESAPERWACQPRAWHDAPRTALPCSKLA